MSSLSDAIVILAAVILAWVAWSTERDQQATEAKQRAEAERQRAIDEYVAPQPENRGRLPFIGYTVTPTPNGRHSYELSYLQPPNVFPADIKTFGAERGWFNCVTRVGENRSSNPVSVHAHLSWERTAPPAEGEAETCTVDGLAQSSEINTEPSRFKRLQRSSPTPRSLTCPERC